jgi:protocatechuate 3,4-dioxygenase, beta subunit
MTDTKLISRRRLIAGAAGLLASANAMAAAQCRLTPRQGEGPYYPEADLNRDNDLTNLGPGKPAALGQVIYLSGLVLDPDCKPVRDAVVEVWQAAASGKYNHSQDPNNLKLDPNFQYWGRTRTDAKGAYVFKSVVPGHYPTGPTTYRPPHIHAKVHAAGFLSLTTQVYFDPRSYDDANLAKIVDRLNKLEQVPAELIVLYQKNSRLPEPGAKSGRFDFTIRPNV